MILANSYVLPVCSFFSAVFFVTIMHIVTSKYRKKSKLRRIEFTDCQSAVIDEKSGTRVSVRKLKVPDIHLLKNPLDFFKVGLEKSRCKPCFGSRESLNSPVKWITYEEVNEKIQYLGSAISNLFGTDPKNNFVGIYGRNSPEWIMTQWANTSYSFVTIPLYSTFGDEAMTHVCRETELRIIVCDTVSQACHLYKLLPTYVETFIIMKPDETYENVKKELSDKVNLFTFKEMLERGRSQCLPLKVAKDNDLVMICYTSGSLGLPKGVMITSEAYVNAIWQIISIQHENHFPNEDVVHFSYLPLSHIMEQLTITFAAYSGARIGFLTSDIRSLFDDLKTYKPTFFCTVPRILSRVYGDFSKRMRSRPIIWKICQRQIKKRLDEQREGLYRTHGLVDYFLFREFRDMLGGQVKVIISASSALDRDFLCFTRAIFGCPVIEMYGSTETSGIVSGTMFEDVDANHVGAIAPGVQIKLIDVPDMDIVVSRDGMGEICVRSKCNMIGYFKNEEKTKETLDSDGFVHTGDVGIWTENGALKIVDRTKNLFKLSQGEYIAPEKVEQTYLSCNLINKFMWRVTRLNLMQ
uniref:long-chain-fatty-acid--CoA ligase n=2 Tax=Trichobilharzia regenti TaxID=157069 RepID=A0AA85JJA0_TRIRE|nr:unnamed protein product [Trichobilharzia regenti]